MKFILITFFITCIAPDVHAMSTHQHDAIHDSICKPSPNVKLVIFVPKSHANAVRDALAKAGAGKIGNYACCSFSQEGIGRWMPIAGAKPLSGTIGIVAETIEERIETVCPKKIVQAVIQEVKKVHPYDHMGYDIYPLLELTDSDE